MDGGMETEKSVGAAQRSPPGVHVAAAQKTFLCMPGGPHVGRPHPRHPVARRQSASHSRGPHVRLGHQRVAPPLVPARGGMLGPAWAASL